MKRIIFNLVLLLVIIGGPWWASVAFGIFTLYYFRFFNEIVLYGLLLDILYGRLSATFSLWDYRFTVFFIILLLSSFYIKKGLKFYSK
jgi:hypothetical protein